MAALSHLKNKKESKLREGIEKVEYWKKFQYLFRKLNVSLSIIQIESFKLFRSFKNVEPGLETILQRQNILTSWTHSILSWIRRRYPRSTRWWQQYKQTIFIRIQYLVTLQISDESGSINRDEFVEYAKRSSAVKELTDKGFAVRSVSTSQTPSTNNLDKAELAFRVRWYCCHDPSPSLNLNQI